MGVAAFLPERLVAAMEGRPARIARLAVDRAERGPAEIAERARMRLAQVEEAVADTAAAVLGQQHRFAAVEYVLDADQMAVEGGADLGRLVGQRQPGGRADDALAVEGQHRHAAPRIAIDLQI
ncbi:hypothetical protein CATMIT_01724, partial [Catenibacterium mitsuokai DSM 15897]